MESREDGLALQAELSLPGLKAKVSRAKMMTNKRGSKMAKHDVDDTRPLSTMQRLNLMMLVEAQSMLRDDFNSAVLSLNIQRDHGLLLKEASTEALLRLVEKTADFPLWNLKVIVFSGMASTDADDTDESLLAGLLSSFKPKREM